MALRNARWPSGKKDKEPGTLDERPGTKKAAGKPENEPSKQNGRPGSQKTGRETKIAVRTTTFRAGKEKRRRESSKRGGERKNGGDLDRKSTRLNSSHDQISYG